MATVEQEVGGPEGRQNTKRMMELEQEFVEHVKLCVFFLF